MTDKERYPKRKAYFKHYAQIRKAKGEWKSPEYKLKRKLWRGGSALKVLETIEKYIVAVDPDEKNKELQKIFIMAHSSNKRNSCYNTHQSWREETKNIANQLKDF